MKARKCYSAVAALVGLGATISTVLFLPATALAQWPTSYLEPKILSSGTNMRAGHVLANADGSVYACFEQITTGGTRLVDPLFDSAGITVHPGDGMPLNLSKVVKVQLMQPSSASHILAVASQFANSVIGANAKSYEYLVINTEHTWQMATYYWLWNFELGLHMADGSNHVMLYEPIARKVGARREFVSPPEFLPLGNGAARNFAAARVTDSKSLIAFEKYTEQVQSASEIWTYTFEGSGSGALGNLRQAQVQAGEAQSAAQLVNYSAGHCMFTWLGTLGNNQRLYAKVLDHNGAEISPARLIMGDIQNYVATTSTLGLPVFAGVQRNHLFTPPLDTLFAGIIDPVNGASLTLPLATGLGLKVKFLRQEKNGDFSVVYSIPENGTTLVKVRRLSGASGSTLWESTVADVGSASDAVVDLFPNTFVSGNTAGVLYILSRYDEPFTNDTSFRLARVRADGQMGADPLVSPTGLGVTPLSPSSARVTWTDTNTAETHYIIARTESDFSGYHILGAVSANETSFDDTGLEIGVPYHYIVAAYDAATGQFALSDELAYQYDVL